MFVRLELKGIALKTILIDTCSNQINLGLAESGKIKASLNLDSGLKHSENLIPSLLFLSEKTEIDLKTCERVICSGGPGSFTGLRIGISTAKGLCMGSGAILKLVPSLDIHVDIDKQGEKNTTVFPVIDARKKRFYTTRFIQGIKQEEDFDLTLEEIMEKISFCSKTILCGPDCLELLDRLPENFKNKNKIKIRENHHIILYNLLRIGCELLEKEGSDHFGIGPFYLRKSEAELDLENRG